MVYGWMYGLNGNAKSEVVQDDAFIKLNSGKAPLCVLRQRNFGIYEQSQLTQQL